MSISTQNNKSQYAKSPLKYIVEYRGGEGIFRYWDNDTKSVVELNELEFIIMDSRVSVTGWSKKAGTIFSNPVTSTKKEAFVVKAKKDKESKSVVIETGLWADIKFKVKAFGGKFTHELYVLANIDGEFQPATIKLAGTACNSWIAFQDEAGGKYSLYGSLITGEKGPKDDEASVTVYPPVFSVVPAPTELLEEAKSFDANVLQPYLMERNAGSHSPEPEGVVG